MTRRNLRQCGLILLLLLAHSWCLAQWVRVPDIPGNRTVFTLLAAGDTLYAATDSLFYVGTGGGTNWSSTGSPIPAPDGVACLLKTGGVIVAGTFQSGVFKSTDEGASWQTFSNGLTALGATSISGLLVRRDSLIMSTLGASVYATSADFSHTWSPWGDSLADYEGDNVFKMTEIGTTVLAGAGGNGYMFRYTDAQPWWNPIAINTPRLVGQFVSGIASSSTTVLAGTNTGVYRSTNEGQSWEATNFSIPPSTIQVFLLFHSPGVFALATTPFSSFLFVSHDDGQTWDTLGNYALPNVLDAAIDGETFFLARPGGLWAAQVSQLVTSVTGRVASPNNFHLDQNYPNPFNPSTTISYTLERESRVRLRVYNMLGEAIETLFDGASGAGLHTVRWNALNAPGGIYYYRLETENASSIPKALSAIKKMVLLK